MAQLNYVETALFEHRFWLQVLGDHARFILDSLSPREVREITRAEYFIRSFDALLQEARSPLDKAQAIALSLRAQKHAEHIRTFKLHLLRRHLVSKVMIQLPPAFLNHMVNEVEEYLQILDCLCQGEVPVLLHPVHHHLLWLQDAMGHAVTLESLADPVESMVRAKSHTFTKHFEAFYLKAVETAGYLRTQEQTFPALARFNSEVRMEMELFREFLNELEELRLDDSVLGTLSPLMADHMAREECYYLLKLAQVTELAPPDCDPAKPRQES